MKIVPVKFESYSAPAYCDHCGKHSDVILFNGVEKWAVEPPHGMHDSSFISTDMAKVSCKNVLALYYLIQSRIHRYERIVFWMEDDASYQHAVKFMRHYIPFWELDVTMGRPH